MNKLQKIPLLGFATTRQLLEEIKARGECEHQYVTDGVMMAVTAAGLMTRLPESMLAYRTVDHD